MFRGKRLNGLPRNQKGITLIEVVLALGLLALIGGGMLAALQTNTKASGALVQEVVAQNLATGTLEAIEKLPFADDYASATANLTIPFQYSVNISTYGTNNDTTWVGPPSSGQTLQKIVVSISQGNKLILSICEYRAKR